MSKSNPTNCVPSRCTLPVIFDIDGEWPGSSDDAAFFKSHENRTFRFRSASAKEFGESFHSVFVIRLASSGFRIRIGLPMTRSYSAVGAEASSDYHASEQLAEQVGRSPCAVGE